MHERSSKIFGIILFLLLVSGIIYLVFFSKGKINNGEIKMIKITGNNLLSQREYLQFTKLDNIANLEELGLPVIKDRFLKHPYVEKVDVEYDGINSVKVELKEKNIKAVILNEGEAYFINDKFQILPLFSNTKFSDLPIISNLPESQKITVLSNLKYDEIVEAFKIIDAAKITNENIFKHLAEINLRKGGDIILTFSGVRPPIIYGKSGAAKKIVYLDIMWDDMVAGKNLIVGSEYIDLRFSNEIYVGKSENAGLN